MGPIKKILAIVDPTATAQPCVEKAALVARCTGAELVLFACESGADAYRTRHAPDDSHSRAQERRRFELAGQLDLLATPFRRQGLRIDTDVEFGSPLYQTIVAKAAVCGADLVVKDTHYHSVINRTFFTNTDWHLIRECPVPLLLTKQAPWQANPRFCAALDPGHWSDRPATLDGELLATTQALASPLQASVSAVHAFDSIQVLAGIAPLPAAIGEPPYYDAELLRAVRESHVHGFKWIVGEYPAFADRAEIIDGTPVTALPAYARSNGIDMMVLGAVARGALHRLLVGSTAERLLDRLPCDILVIKPGQLVKELAAGQRAA